VYFINHLNDAGLLPNEKYVQDLIKVQDMVVELECLKKNALGMHGEGGYTFCNHAAFLTIQAIDGNYRQFIGYPDLYKDDFTSPWDLKRLNNDVFIREIGEYKIKETNIWCDILRKQAENSLITGICKIEAKEAQEKANFGYVVIAAWQNTMEGNYPPHYATVRPRHQCTAEGPMIANVGEKNEKEIRASKCFNILTEIEYYYNKNHDFISPYLDNIEKLEKGGKI
jgi:hypothetical protein